MTIPEPPSWVNLLTLMVHGPDLPVHGVLRSVGEDEYSEMGWMASSPQDMPAFAGLRGGATSGSVAEDPVRVWWDGTHLRVEELDGRINIVADAETCWQWEPGNDVPCVIPRRLLRLGPGPVELLQRRAAEDFLGDDFTRPAGPVGVTTFLGRLAWTVELAPPSHKPHPMQLVIDAETGLRLQQRNDGFGTREEWLAFERPGAFDPDLFRWKGPVRERLLHFDDSWAEHERDMAARRAWFTANVAPIPLPVEIAVDVHVHHREDDGSFEASIDRVGSLARRPRSAEPWVLGWACIDHRWTTERWDWALHCYDGKLTERGLENLKAHLRDLP